MRKTITLALVIGLCSCFAARVDINKHPDYYFPPTNPKGITLYNGFLPKNEFIIIGQITIAQAILDSMSKTIEVVYKKAAQIGGDAILVSHSAVQWMNYNKAVTTGSANVYDYGYNIYGTWTQTTKQYQTAVPVRRYYYLYVLRWKDRSDISETKVETIPPQGIPAPKTDILDTDKSFTEETAQSELGEAETLFFQGAYNEAIAKVASLKNAVEASHDFKNKNEYLTKIHFLCGAYYVVINKPAVAIIHFRKTLKYDPHFEFARGKFSQEIIRVFEQAKTGLLPEVTKEKGASREPVPMADKEIQARDEKYFRGSRIRIIKENALLKIKPDNESITIRNLPLGSIFEVDNISGEWIRINLPPDKDGIIITGYVHSSFIEPKEIKEKSETNNQNSFKIKDQIFSKKDSKSDYDLNSRLIKAKSKRSTGLVLTIIGGAVFVPCMILTFAHQNIEYDYFTIYPIAYEKKARAGYLIGDGLGLGALIAGLAIYLPASQEVKALNSQGQIVSYLRIYTIPESCAIGFQLGFNF